MDTNKEMLLRIELYELLGEIQSDIRLGCLLTAESHLYNFQAKLKTYKQLCRGEDV